MSEKLVPSRAYRSLLFFFPDALVERLLRQHAPPPISQPPWPPRGYAVLPYDAYLAHFVQSLLVQQQGPAAVW